MKLPKHVFVVIDDKGEPFSVWLTKKEAQEDAREWGGQMDGVWDGKVTDYSVVKYSHLPKKDHNEGS